MYYESNELYHHGVKGMKWGVRKYQNADGSLTPLGKKRQVMLDAKSEKKIANKAYNKAFNKATSLRGAYGPNNKKYTDDLVETAEKSAAADNKYKQAKKEFKNAKSKAIANGKKPIDTTKMRERINKGAHVVSGLIVTDMLTNGGVRKAAKYTGRAVVSAFVYANGGRNIRWYDN